MKGPESIFVDNEYLRDIREFVSRGRNKIQDDKYKYSTKNIQIPLNFEIEDIFLNDGDGQSQLPRAFTREQREQITNIRAGKMRNQPQHFYYNKHNEFMHLEDFLEFYDQFMEKRKEETEKLHYKRKFMNEVDRIQTIKKQKFMKTEKIQLGGTVSPVEMKKLEQQLQMFENGLNYAINNMSYKQAERMLRKLNTLPQAPLQISLGYRTRLFRIKTGGNLDRALNNILDDRKQEGTLGTLQVDSEETIIRRLRQKGNRYGQFIKK